MFNSNQTGKGFDAESLNQDHNKTGLVAKSKGGIRYFVPSQFREKLGLLSKIKETTLELAKAF